jgi:outer membrane protein assembly factor BamD (BamD/ComL family)
MRRAFLALGLSVVFAVPAVAERPSQLELVRALRQAGLVDLAIQRLEELKAKPGLLTAEEAQIVPLELARIRLEEASRETEDSRRTSLIGMARASFDEFIKNNATHPMAAQANVEIARLYALQAKGQLSRANRLENREAKALEFSRARPDFVTAINRYKGAITNLENRLKKVDAKDPLAAELLRSKAQAELDAAVLRYDLALTFIGEDETRQKGEEVAKAQKEFDGIASKYSNTRIGHLANVWSSQCSFINGDEAKAILAIDNFVKANRGNREAAEAIRLAGFFGIEHVYSGYTDKETTPAAKFMRTEQAALKWLQTYPEAKNTPEGLGARYRRALMKELQAYLPGGVAFQDPPKVKTPPKTTPKSKEKEKEKEAQPPQRKIVGISPQARQLLEDANKIYKELTETDNEYSDRAHRHRLTNQLVILEADGRGGDPPLKSINTLEQAYLAAQVQQARIYDLPKSGKSEQEQDAEEKQRVKKAIEYLERGLQRVSPKDSPRDVFDAQMLQVQFLSKQDRAIEAAVLGEGLARNNPRMPRAAVAAALAVYAYNSALAKLKESPARTDEAEDADVRRIVTLAQFAEKTWPNDGPTDAIRHVLAFYQSNRDKDHATAWQTYSRIGNGYSEIYQARREMAAAMFYMIRPEEKSDPKKYRDALAKNITEHAQQFRATLAALESMPEPPSSIPAHQAESWAGAKTMQAQLYYMNGDYDKVDAVVKATVEGLTKLAGLDAKKRDDLAFTIRGLKYNALQGRAAEFIKAKEFAKVGETLGAELDALKKELKAPPPEETPGLARLRKAQRDFLIACMSAYVQNKQGDQASELLDALQGSGGSLEQNVATMRTLNVTIANQISSLSKEGKKQDADDLARSYADFLDKIKGDDANLEKLPKTVVAFLGQGYGAVNQHARAAELFGLLLAKTDEAKDQGFHRQLQFFQARALRQSGKFPEASALMQKIVGDPLKKGTRGWGYSNIEIRKEYNMLLEDQKLFGPAVNNWVKLTNDFVPGGLPVPIRFLGQRPAFIAFGQAADSVLGEAFGIPCRVSLLLDTAFKQIFPSIAEKRNSQRLVYFDLFVEAQRCSARAYSDPVIVAKIKGGQDTANQKLADIGQKLFELLTKNDDVPTEVKENVRELLDQHPQMKRKFDELVAAGPKS